MFVAYAYSVVDALSLTQFNLQFVIYNSRIWPTYFLTQTMTVASELILLLFSNFNLDFIVASAIRFCLTHRSSSISLSQNHSNVYKTKPYLLPLCMCMSFQTNFAPKVSFNPIFYQFF